MYILGLCSSWGTSRICPSWSPSEHLLTPALSPFGGPASEVKLSRGDCLKSSWQLLTFHPTSFPSKRSSATFGTEIISYSTQQYHSYLLYITFIRTFTSFIFTCLIHTFTSSYLDGRLAALGFLCPIHYFCILGSAPLEMCARWGHGQSCNMNKPVYVKWFQISVPPCNVIIFQNW